MRKTKILGISLFPDTLKHLDNIVRANKSNRSETIAALIDISDVLLEMGLLQELFTKLQKLPKEKQYEKFHQVIETLEILA